MAEIDRRTWSEEDDEAIKDLVKLYGTKRWAAVAEQLAAQYQIEGRTSKQCRERWHNHLDPNINKEPWSEKEEDLLFEK
jgi:myb proto-oncogene protein